MAAALLVGLGAAVTTTRGGEYDGNPPEARGLLSGLFHEKPRGQAKMDKKASEEPRQQPGGTVAAVEVDRQRRENALFRRMQVCDRLRTIADQTGNEALMNQANELEDRANAIYRQQTARLPLPAQAPLAVLANDNESAPRPNGPIEEGRVKTSASAESLSLPQRPLRSIGSTAGLGRNLDQREQAILNGKSMGGD
ncbi:MAG: hypothetical protein ACYC3I_02375 [Gemmataceae bacterium]